MDREVGSGKLLLGPSWSKFSLQGDPVYAALVSTAEKNRMK